MKRLFLLIIIGLLYFLPVSAQTQMGSDSITAADTALLNIYRQLIAFPQEKIYIQIDKPYYVAGETVFYRLFLLDACFHVPFSVSRYVYVELIDQNNSVEIRQKLRPDEKGMYYSSLKLSEHLAQGYYKIRAYTRFMENRGMESFYSKPVYVIAENQEHLKMEMNVSATDKKHTSAELRFVDARTGIAATPEDIFLQLNGKKQKASHKKGDGIFKFELPLTDNDRERNLYVEVLNSEDSVIFKQFDIVPYTSDSIELSFYPEGGYMVEGQPNTITFKALNKEGAPAKITGAIVDTVGTRVSKLSTRHEGMGTFFLMPKEGEIFFAEYTSGNKQYRTQLPDFKKNSFSLHAAWKNDQLMVSVNSEPNAVLPKMLLLVHCRGFIIYSDLWDADRQAMIFEKDILRSGVNHILLLSEDYQPLSERLIFCNKNDHIKPEIKPDKKEYKNREHVTMNISLFHTGSSDIEDNTNNIGFEDSITYDKNGIRQIYLPEVEIKGKRIRKKSKVSRDLAVSVTDDNNIQIDTMTNILTQILLESELKGTISNPAYYFSETPEAAFNADLLMMTHGWTRYDIPKALRGEWTLPLIEPEISQTLTGQVKGGLIPRAASNIDVFVISYQGKEKYYDVTKTDENGFFRFENFELPDSSEIVLQVLKDKKKTKGLLEVFPDTIKYPLAGSFGFPQYYIKTTNPFIEKTIADID
ncbi:MAG: hypothetical protein LBN11_03310, partial [Tannerella sp.]|nr:hypothetical protein [Tannerella sp.]